MLTLAHNHTKVTAPGTEEKFERTSLFLCLWGGRRPFDLGAEVGQLVAVWQSSLQVVR